MAQPRRNHTRTKVMDIVKCTYHGSESHGSENDREAKAVDEGRQMRGHRWRGPCGGTTMKQDAKKLGNQEARRKMQSRKDARKQRRFKTQRKQRSYTQEAKKSTSKTQDARRIQEAKKQRSKEAKKQRSKMQDV